MTNIRIGHVDLDTSHPGNWIPIERELGYSVAGVYDSGTVFPAGYAAEFAAKHEISRVFHDLDEMADAIDIAIIHSCNWDLHVERAAPFVAAGKSVLIDKPMVGNLNDAQKLLAWQAQGHRITGGSSLYLADEVQAYLAEPVDQRGTPAFVYAGCAVDDFNYGSHAYALAHALMGPGVQRVRFLGRHGQKQIEAVWADGRRAIITVGEAGGYLPFYATVVTERQVRHLQIDSRQLYRALLSRTLPYLSGDGDAPVPLGVLLEVELTAVAGLRSEQASGQTVALAELDPAGSGYDGDAFAAHYKELRMRQSR